METIIKEHLENGEQLLWCGKASSDKVMDRTYSLLYCLVILISYGIAAATLFLAYKSTGELKISVVLFLLIIGSILPLSALYDGIKVRELGYAATDRRLIRANGSELYSADYKDIAKSASARIQAAIHHCFAERKPLNPVRHYGAAFHCLPVKWKETKRTMYIIM